MASGADVDGTNVAGETPLVLASRVAANCAKHPSSKPGTRLELVQELVRNGADVNVRDPPTGETLLMDIADMGDAPLCTLLLEARADLLAKSNAGLTAMKISMEAGCLEVFEVLRKAASPAKAILQWACGTTKTKVSSSACA